MVLLQQLTVWLYCQCRSLILVYSYIYRRPLLLILGVMASLPYFPYSILTGYWLIPSLLVAHWIVSAIGENLWFHQSSMALEYTLNGVFVYVCQHLKQTQPPGHNNSMYFYNHATRSVHSLENAEWFLKLPKNCPWYCARLCWSNFQKYSNFWPKLQ